MRPSSSADPRAGVIPTIRLQAADDGINLTLKDCGRRYEVTDDITVNLPNVADAIDGAELIIQCTNNTVTLHIVSGLFYRNGQNVRGDLDTLSPTYTQTVVLKYGSWHLRAKRTSGWEILPDSNVLAMSELVGHGPLDTWAMLFQRETDPLVTSLYFEWQSSQNWAWNMEDHQTYAGHIVIIGQHAGDTGDPTKRGLVEVHGDVVFYKHIMVAGALSTPKVSGSSGGELAVPVLNVSVGTPSKFEIIISPTTQIEARYFARMTGIQGMGCFWT